MPEIRYLFQHKISLFIKISSLAIGLVIGLVLFSKVAFESSYDRFFKDCDRIYRIEFVADKESGREQYAGIMAGVASVLADNLPGTEAATTLYRPGDHLLYFDGQEYETKIVYADSSFLKVLDFNIIQGSATGLAQENNLMIS
jgi:putative ABC transport system permease protein